MAHIYSFSEKGPRGWGPFKFKPAGRNDISNLLLVCHDCHKKIDKEKDGGRYPAALLIKWKEEHERRITMVTGVNPSKRSHVLLYGANIGDESSLLQPEYAKWALFPEWYPAEGYPITLGMSWEGRDDNPKYWEIELENIEKAFERQVVPLIVEGCHFSIFGLAPMPLLIRLGTLFTDKIDAQVYQIRDDHQVYQLHREPKKTWQWCNTADDNPYRLITPAEITGPPALIFSLSDNVARDRITSVLGPDVSIWELTIEEPNNDFLQTALQLSKFRKLCRRLMVCITKAHGIGTPLAIFPVMPVACAIELGRIRMPKAQMPWTIYDHNDKLGAFAPAITVGGSPSVIHATSSAR